MTSKKTKNKNERLLKVIGLTFAALILSALPISMLVKASANFAEDVPVLTRTANLKSPSGALNPHGAAILEVYSKRKPRTRSRN